MADGAPAAGDERLFVVTHVDVISRFLDEAVPLLRADLAARRADPQVERAELWRQAARKNHFELLTVWSSPAAYEAHLSSAATVAFREQLHPMLGSPYDDRLHVSLDAEA